MTGQVSVSLGAAKIGRHVRSAALPLLPLPDHLILCFSLEESASPNTYSKMTSTESPIPGPKGVPFLGNIYDVDREVPIHSLELLADNYGFWPHLRPML